MALDHWYNRTRRKRVRPKSYPKWHVKSTQKATETKRLCLASNRT